MTSLRTRLAASIAAILAVALLVTFAAVYRGTGSELRNRIDADLAAELEVLVGRVAANDSSPLADPSITSASQLLVVDVPGRPPATNRPELLGLEDDDDDDPAERREERREDLEEARRLLTAPEGYATVTIDDVGSIRVLSQTVALEGGQMAMLRAAEPLNDVQRAQEGVARTFLAAGSVTLLIAMIVGWLVAAGTAAPLRRIARTAARVQGGQLSERIGPQASSPHEIRELAHAFDTMLGRLEDAFARERAFAADASHELRTPLTVVRGQLEVLARQPNVTHEDVLRVERVVGNEVQRMERLVDDLLLLAHSEHDAGARHTNIDVREFLTELFDGLTLTATRRFELGELPAGHLTGDSDRLAQAVRNLTRNAVEHTQEDGLVRLEALERPGGLEIAVIDDGPGIPPEERTQVFDRLHRVDTARTRSKGGAGLGLAITRAVVEAHGGDVWAEDTAAGGARVALLLPGFRPARDTGSS